jgi:hypothetical protein
MDCIKNGIGINKKCETKYFSQGQFRYIPRLLNHKILQAENNTISILFTGPYSELWTEEIDDKLILLTTGRIPIYEVKMKE